MFAFIKYLLSTYRNIFRKRFAAIEANYKRHRNMNNIRYYVCCDEGVTNRCIGCELCKIVCPVGAIEIELDKETGKVHNYRLDMSKCIACNLCVEACPIDAMCKNRNAEHIVEESMDLFVDKTKSISEK